MALRHRRLRPPRQTRLSVWYEHSRVGTLRKAADGGMEFSYDPAWIGAPGAFPVTSALPLSDRTFRGAVAFSAFDNLLPDSEGELRPRIAERIAAAGTDVHSLLAALGRDCVGALQFLPEGEVPEPGPLRYRLLKNAEIADDLGGLTAAPLGLERDEDFRISIAGAQEKTALLLLPEGWAKPHGITPTSHIFKTPMGVLPGPDRVDLSDSVENEAFCLRLSAELGLPTAKAEIKTFDGQKALVVERFDRRWENGILRRLPQEDFCQALGIPSTQKYQKNGGPGIQDIMRHLQESDDPRADREIFFKAQIFFFLIGATDGHAKNFSLHLGVGGRFRLAPLYDVLSLAPAIESGRLQRKRFRLAMAIDGKYGIDELVPRHFETTAVAGGLPAGEATRLLKELCLAMPGAVDRSEAALGPTIPASVSGPIRRRAVAASAQMLALL